jgi:hypothetical protein
LMFNVQQRSSNGILGNISSTIGGNRGLNNPI